MFSARLLWWLVFLFFKAALKISFSSLVRVALRVLVSRPFNHSCAKIKRKSSSVHGLQALNLYLCTCLWHNVFHRFKERSQPIASSEAKRSTAENLGLGMLVKLWVLSVVLCVQQRSLSPTHVLLSSQTNSLQQLRQALPILSLSFPPRYLRQSSSNSATGTGCSTIL